MTATTRAAGVLLLLLAGLLCWAAALALPVAPRFAAWLLDRLDEIDVEA